MTEKQLNETVNAVLWKQVQNSKTSHRLCVFLADQLADLFRVGTKWPEDSVPPC